MRLLDISPSVVYHMVTTAPAAILRPGDAQGSIQESGLADLIAVRDTGQHAAARLATLSMYDVELVMIGGIVQLVSEDILGRLPLSAKRGLEPLSIDGSIRWLRAPVKALFEKTEEVLGSGEVRLGRRKLLLPDCVVAEHVN
jgi:hypothetical protein